MEVVQSRENEPVDPNGLAREGYLAILATMLCEFSSSVADVAL